MFNFDKLLGDNMLDVLKGLRYGQWEWTWDDSKAERFFEMGSVYYDCYNLYFHLWKLSIYCGCM